MTDFDDIIVGKPPPTSFTACNHFYLFSALSCIMLIVAIRQFWVSYRHQRETDYIIFYLFITIFAMFWAQHQVLYHLCRSR